MFGGNGNAQLSIYNHCPAITTEQRDSLFEKFTRLDERLTRTTRGTGLGLFITKGLVKAMNGAIDLNTDNGFTVTTIFPTQQNSSNKTPMHTVNNIQTSLQSGQSNWPNATTQLAADADDEAIGV